MHLVEQVHAVLLSGGSAFGLDAAGGVVRYLEERGVGFNVGVARVPIVPAAILFDLGIGRADVRPDAAMGYQACLNASAGRIRGPPKATSAPARAHGRQDPGHGPGHEIRHRQRQPCTSASGGFVGAIVAVNAFGDVVDPADREDHRRAALAASKARSRSAPARPVRRHPGGDGRPGGTHRDGLCLRENTVIGVVATNARLTKEQANKVAQMAQDGVARTVRPAHTMLDGDTIFALSTGKRKADVNIVGAFAAEVFAQAILRAVRLATSAGGVPCPLT